MPFYEYLCAEHGIVTEMRPISRRDSRALCPDCGASAARVISAPRLQVMSANNRVAWERNERSTHEPQRRTRSSCGHIHAAGQNCASGTTRTQAAPPGLRAASPGGRPWMLGH
jgi:putative FmdB family regulatory protein